MAGDMHYILAPDGHFRRGGAYIAKLNALGEHVWSKAFCDISFADVAAAGQIVLAGDFTNTIDLGTGPLSSRGGLDAFLAVLDP